MTFCVWTPNRAAATLGLMKCIGQIGGWAFFGMEPSSNCFGVQSHAKSGEGRGDPIMVLGIALSAPPDPWVGLPRVLILYRQF